MRRRAFFPFAVMALIQFRCPKSQFTGNPRRQEIRNSLFFLIAFLYAQLFIHLLAGMPTDAKAFEFLESQKTFRSGQLGSHGGYTGLKYVCPHCNGKGRIQCIACQGRRFFSRRCMVCDGTGRKKRNGRDYGRCPACYGTGHEPCKVCTPPGLEGRFIGPLGHVACPMCGGTGYITFGRDEYNRYERHWPEYDGIIEE